MDIRRIVVPVDFSDTSKTAMEYAAFLARGFNAHLTLLHVVGVHFETQREETRIRMIEEFVQPSETQRARDLEHHKNRLGLPEELIETKLFRGDSVADAIVDFIRDHAFDLVVMGNYGNTGLRKWVLGSVAERVVRLSPTPVLTVHRDWSDREIRNILVPVDFSGYSARAVEWGTRFASMFGANLNIFHVIEVGLLPSFYNVHIYAAYDDETLMKKRALESLHDFVGPEKVADTHFAVAEGKPHHEIKKYAEKHHIDLIIMAIRGRSDLEDFIIGSNALRMVAVAPCPLLTVGRAMAFAELAG